MTKKYIPSSSALYGNANALNSMPWQATVECGSSCPLDIGLLEVLVVERERRVQYRLGNI